LEFFTVNHTILKLGALLESCQEDKVENRFCVGGSILQGCRVFQPFAKDKVADV
jgi:hypothetical protein